MSEVKLSSNYRPSEKEKFMSTRQKEFFRRRLSGWRDEILRDAQDTIQNLQEDDGQAPDIADRATTESERSIELRTRDRQRKLVSKIDAALGRIDEGSYGYCDDTGEPIGLKRLEARPIATLSIEAQERHERRERLHRDE
jgi:DnaK suppressor protein